jgi:hypothetical protein
MDWETIGAVAGAVTAVLGAVAAITGLLGKAWRAGRQWHLRRTKSPEAGKAARAAAPSTAPTRAPVDQALRKRDGFWIIYRREDAAGTAQRLHEELSRRYGAKKVWMDPEPDDAPPGSTESFREVARRSDVALVLMGPEWLRSEDERARLRLWSPDDPVRRQIAAALSSAETTVLPILVRGARMCTRDELPEEISVLARRNVLEVSQSSLEYDIARVAELAGPWA